MEAAQQFILVADRDAHEANHIAVRTAQDIIQNKLTLVETVKSVAEFINHDDATTRSKAVRYLSSILQNLPDKYLSRQQVTVLAEFFLARAVEGGSLDALGHLQKSSRFADENVVSTFRTLSRSYVDMQTFPQSRRNEVYRLLSGLMLTRRSVLKRMENESLTMIIGLVAGEKDPRNLMIVFSILHAVIAEWDISRQIEPVFESIFCYFPITFRQPPNDPYRITAQDLKDRLKECIAANSLFAAYAFPQLLNKLDSTSQIVKRDVLQVLRACSQNYGAAVISTFVPSIWESLKFEILAGQEEDIVSEALEVIKAIVVNLDDKNSSAKIPDSLSRYLQMITKELGDLISGPDRKQARSASRILHNVASSSANSFTYVAQHIFPELVENYRQRITISERESLLETMSQIFDAGKPFENSDASQELLSNESTSRSRDLIFSMLSQALMNSSTDDLTCRVLALKCLHQGCCYQKFFSDSEVKLAVQYFNEFLLGGGSNGRQRLRDAAAEALRDVSIRHPHHILEISLPMLLAQLPDSENPSTYSFLDVLDAIGKIGTSRNVSDTVLRRLFTRTEILVKGSCDETYLRAILMTIEYILMNIEGYPDMPRLDYLEKVKTVVRSVVRSSINSSTGTPLRSVPGSIALGRVLCALVKSIAAEDQRRIGNEIYSLFTDNPVFPFKPTTESVNSERKLTIFLSTSLLAAIPKTSSLSLPFDRLSDLANHLILCAEKEENSIIRRGIHQHATLLISKFCSLEDLEHIHVVCWLCHKDVQSAFVPNKHSIQTLFWVSKALIGRSYNINQVITSLVSLLNTGNLADLGARGFGLLIEHDPVVNRENGATIRLLSRQRLVTLLLPQIVANFTSTESEAKKMNCLVALSELLKEVYNESYLLEVGGLVPLLLQSLSSCNRGVCLTALLATFRLLHENPQSLEGHWDTLLGHFENILNTKDANNSELRGHAIKVLCLVPKVFPRVKVLNSQTKVTNLMAIALDDPRRTIRKAAVDCCHIWSSIESQED